jgi:hypothetical protein
MFIIIFSMHLYITIKMFGGRKTYRKTYRKGRKACRRKTRGRVGGRVVGRFTPAGLIRYKTDVMSGPNSQF